jgi:magnesium-transporting ATPase (P-type)
MRSDTEAEVEVVPVAAMAAAATTSASAGAGKTELDLDQVVGLSAEEAARRLKHDGYNELAKEKPRSMVAIIFGVIKEPMFILLMICVVLCFVLRDYAEGGMLAAVSGDCAAFGVFFFRLCFFFSSRTDFPPFPPCTTSSFCSSLESRFSKSERRSER